jgi:molecular chaperone DnaK (HSP70)
MRTGYFKLLLDKNSTTTQYDNPQLAGTPTSDPRISLPAGKSALVVTADYLRHLYAHLMETLRERLVITLDSTPIQFVLTTPAIWSHEAQDATCEAAKMAGFTSRPGDTLWMVSEPEAAASYCIKDVYAQRKDTESPLKVGLLLPPPWAVAG